MQEWPVAWGALLGVVLFAVAHDAMPDDGLISLSFARNLAEHGQWALTTGIESNTATSPLNVWLLAGLHILTGYQAFLAAGLLLCACLAVAAWWLHHLGGPVAAVVGPALLATSPVLTSAIGLEPFLCSAVIIGVVRYGSDARWGATGLLTGAAFLARPDLTIAAVAAVVVLAVTVSRRLVLALPLGAAVALPWVLFSWLHFGSAWANSVAVKWANGSWGGSTLFTPAFWWPTYGWATVAVAVTLAAGLAALGIALWRQQWSAVAIGAAGAAHIGALACTETPPIEYYLAPAVTGLGLALVLVAARSRPWAAVVPGLVVAGCVAGSIAHGSLWVEGLAPMRQNWATDAQYAAIARDLPTDGVVMGGEIGALAFYCQDRGCTVVDPVLSDPGRVDHLVARWRAAHPSWELNYLHYEVPPRTPVRYRLELGLTEPGPGRWPVSRSPDRHEWARLLPEPDPQVAN
ncbi:hypothetical protein [Actinomycetospora lutea]|uniref:hypothetical protein n=1 Tax=Actinomycetospora lutea TaxID=663604 RepID=UPI0023652CB0|nr:hypothetical protein [Actinomycetospora lutea]